MLSEYNCMSCSVKVPFGKAVLIFRLLLKINTLLYKDRRPWRKLLMQRSQSPQLLIYYSSITTLLEPIAGYLVSMSVVWLVLSSFTHYWHHQMANLHQSKKISYREQSKPQMQAQLHPSNPPYDMTRGWRARSCVCSNLHQRGVGNLAQLKPSSPEWRLRPFMKHLPGRSYIFQSSGQTPGYQDTYIIAWSLPRITETTTPNFLTWCAWSRYYHFEGNKCGHIGENKH